MANFIDKCKSVLEKLRDYHVNDLKQIRKEKAEILRMKAEIESMVRGRYVRDDERIIISAPEIIIGNVDEEGVLRSDSLFSHVVIRSNNIDIEGTSPAGTVSGGTITQRASVISTIAVDPGVDGLEDVVGDNSAIIQQARSISLISNDSKDVFTYRTSSPQSGIALNSDTKVAINATPSKEMQSKNIKDEVNRLVLAMNTLTKEIGKSNNTVNEKLDALKEKVKKIEGLTESEWTTAVNVGDLYKGNNELTAAKSELRAALDDEITLYSKLMELDRKVMALKEKDSRLKGLAKFKENSTGGQVSINGELISLTSIDGDGNLRTNEGASIEMQAKTVKILSMDEQNRLMEKGQLYVNAQNINLSAANHTQDGEKTKATATGTVNVLSKKVNIGGVDYEKQGDDVKIVGQTAGGEMNVRMESVRFLSADNTGKSNGQFSANANSIHLKSMDVNNDKTFTDKELAQGSWTQILSGKISIGELTVNDKKYNQSSETYVTSNTIGLFGDKIQGLTKDGNNNITVDKNGMISNIPVNFNKSLTVGGTSDFKDKMTGGEAVFKNLEATGWLKTSNLNDGVKVPVPVSQAEAAKKVEKEKQDIKVNNNAGAEEHQEML